MALREVLSPALRTRTFRLHSNDNLGLFGYVVRSLKPVTFDLRTRPALRSFRRVVDLNDNDAIILAGRRTVPAPKPVNLTASRRTHRPVVAIQQPPADILPWPDQKSRRRPKSPILWNLGLVCVVAVFLAAALPA